MFEQFLHFPDLFSLLDIFLPLFLLLLFCPDINDDSLGFGFQQYVCFPKKIMNGISVHYFFTIGLRLNPPGGKI